MSHGGVDRREVVRAAVAAAEPEAAKRALALRRRLDGPCPVEGDARSRSGAGLGLTTARGFAQLHGGDTTAWSPGGGREAVSTLRLPLRPPLEERPGQPGARASAPAPPRAPPAPPAAHPAPPSPPSAAAESPRCTKPGER